VSVVDNIVRRPGRITTTAIEPAPTCTPSPLLPTTIPNKKRKSAGLSADSSPVLSPTYQAGKRTCIARDIKNSDTITNSLPAPPGVMITEVDADLAVCESTTGGDFGGDGDDDVDVDVDDDTDSDNENSYTRTRKTSMIEIKITLVRP